VGCIAEQTRFRTMTPTEMCLSMGSSAVIIMLKPSSRSNEESMKEILQKYEQINMRTRATYLIFPTFSAPNEEVLSLSWFDGPIQDGTLSGVFEVDARDKAQVVGVRDGIIQQCFAQSAS
jgi:hypothetical protein